MSQTRPNKITVPINSDGYNLAPDLATMADSVNTPILVASTTERDALTKYVGMAVVRTDRGGNIQTWDGAAWNSPAGTSTALNPNDTNWNVIGGITRTYAGGEFSQFRAVAKITRVAGPAFSIGSSFQQTFTNIVPSGWRPGQYQDVYASLCDNADAPQATLQGRLGSDGSLIFRVNTGPASVTVSTNWKIFLDCGWWI